MAEVKTKLNKASVSKFLNSIKDKQKSEDCKVICEIMEKATKSKGEMWGTSIIGFGRRKYKYTNGKEVEWMQLGFAPRKQNIALYGLIVYKISEGGLKKRKKEKDFLLKLGKYKEGGGCLYIKRLSQVNVKELERIVKLAVKRNK